MKSPAVSRASSLQNAIAVLGGIELYRLYPKIPMLVVSICLVAFEASAVLILRAHYTMDVFAGAMAAIVASSAASWICLRFENQESSRFKQ